jgi:hypothetical protein
MQQTGKKENRVNKTSVSLLSIILGFIAGILTGYAVFTAKSPAPRSVEKEHYYYRLNDTTVVRHTISASDSGVIHALDTIAVIDRGW